MSSRKSTTKPTRSGGRTRPAQDRVKPSTGPVEITVAGTTYTCPFVDVIPRPTDDELNELRADIQATGIRVPIEVTPENEVLDGHTRLMIAAELQLTDIPVRVVEGLTADGKRERAVAVNLHRRHLDGGQRRALAALLLEEDPTRSDRSIAAPLKLSHVTVAKLRKKMQTSGQIVQSETTRGRDGLVRRRAKKSRPPAVPEPAGGTGSRPDVVAADEPTTARSADLPTAPRAGAPGTDDDRDDPVSVKLAIAELSSGLQDVISLLHRQMVAPAPDPDQLRVAAENLDRLSGDLRRLANR